LSSLIIKKIRLRLSLSLRKRRVKKVTCGITHMIC